MHTLSLRAFDLKGILTFPESKQSLVGCVLLEDGCTWPQFTFINIFVL